MENKSRTERQASQSAGKLLVILEQLSENRSPVRLQELAAQVNMTQPTVLRYLYTLEDMGYIYKEEESGRYAMTWRACVLGRNLNSFLSLRNIASPFVAQLAEKLALGVCLVVEQNRECMYLDCVDDPSCQILQYIGKRAPIHATGSGKLFLSQYNESELNEFLSSGSLIRFTENTITEPDVLRSKLEEIRRSDLAMDEEECELGLRCVSRPLRDFTGRIAACISVFGSPKGMTDQALREKIVPALCAAAERISLRLGYQGGV